MPVSREAVERRNAKRRAKFSTCRIQIDELQSILHFARVKNLSAETTRVVRLKLRELKRRVGRDPFRRVPEISSSTTETSSATSDDDSGTSSTDSFGGSNASVIMVCISKQPKSPVKNNRPKVTKITSNRLKSNKID
jgi:hypothetical protein